MDLVRNSEPATLYPRLQPSARTAASSRQDATIRANARTAPMDVRRLYASAPDAPRHDSSRARGAIRIAAVSRSVITATDAAPAAMTSGAAVERDAADGDDRLRRRPGARCSHQLETARGRSRCPSWRCRRPARPRGSRPRSPAPRRPAAASCVDRPTTPSARRPRARRPAADRPGRRGRRPRRAMPRDVGAVVDDHRAPTAAAAATIARRRDRGSAPDAAALGAQLDAARAPPCEAARAPATRLEPALAADVDVEDGIEALGRRVEQLARPRRDPCRRPSSSVR